MDFGPVPVMLIYGLWLAGTVAAAYGLFDALRHTALEWAAIRQARWVWIVLLAIALPGGLFSIWAVYYWLRVSPQLKAATAQAA